jgi:Putative peptidoglycan binding domain/LysM domain
MPDYTVVQGDCLSSIADKFGLLKDTVWNHGRNDELRTKRPNPDTLLPGDVIFVPPPTLKEIGCATDRRHEFVRKLEVVRFRLRLLWNDQPRANEGYVLEVGTNKYSGDTDGDGWIDVEIPAHEPQGILTLQEGAEQYTIGLGTLDPIDEITGIQGRLSNLAYLPGEITGQWDDDTADAVRALQVKNQLPATGEMDAETESALKKEYGH